jgi:hypothetical protein
MQHRTARGPITVSRGHGFVRTCLNAPLLPSMCSQAIMGLQACFDVSNVLLAGIIAIVICFRLFRVDFGVLPAADVSRRADDQPRRLTCNIPWPYRVRCITDGLP